MRVKSVTHDACFKHPLPYSYFVQGETVMHTPMFMICAQDIANLTCAVKSGSDPTAVCDSLVWACTSQNFADVSAACTTELFACCGSPTTCDLETLYSECNKLETIQLLLFNKTSWLTNL